MRWFDAYVDWLHRTSSPIAIGALAALGAFGRIGSIINLVIGSGLTVWGVVTGITGQPPGYGLALFGCVLAASFVRIVVRAFRGDFDGFVIHPDEDDGNESFDDESP